MPPKKYTDRNQVELLFLTLALGTLLWALAVRWASAGAPLPPAGPGDTASILYKLSGGAR